VVDDSPLNRELARSTLEPFGYKVLLANSVRQGWDRVQQEHIDLILCDLHMPDEDGFVMVRKIKADQRLADIPFMFLSASSKSTDEYQQAQALGVTRFLRRPIEPQILIKEIEMCLPPSLRANPRANEDRNGH
jgi:CheY-like chemotaxis protein